MKNITNVHSRFSMSLVRKASSGLRRTRMTRPTLWAGSGNSISSYYHRTPLEERLFGRPAAIYQQCLPRHRPTLSSKSKFPLLKSAQRCQQSSLYTITFKALRHRITSRDISIDHRILYLYQTQLKNSDLPVVGRGSKISTSQSLTMGALLFLRLVFFYS